MNSLPEFVLQNLRQHGLFHPRQKILVAVSGGLDSMVLLGILHELSAVFSWRLTVAHLNHQLRGRASTADERLVIRTAEQLDLPSVTESADVKQLAQAGKISVEMAARQARHDFLARTARRLRIQKIALAHHADDQLELFFLRLLRGSGGEGLSGMPWINPSPGDPRVQLVRPLLNMSKSDLLSFAIAKNLVFHQDATNASLDILRNRVRHLLLPLLRRDYQPALDRVIPRVMDLVGAEADLAMAAAAEWLRDKLGAFGSLPLAVQRRVIHRQLIHSGITPDFHLVEQLRTTPGQPFTLSPQLSVRRSERGDLDLIHPPAPPAPRVAKTVDLGIRPGTIDFGAVRLSWRRLAGSAPLPICSHPGQELFDADKIGLVITLRQWEPGDRFQPSGRSQAVKLQDLFTNQKIPKSERHGLVVAATAAGEIFWVEQLRISERFKLSSTSNRRLLWRWNRP